MSRLRRRRRAAALLAAAALAAGATSALAGCSKDSGSVADQARAGDRKGYVAGDGSWEILAVADRGAPIVLAGPTVDGATWDIASAKGKIVVINTWASWCGPCLKETPEIAKAYAATRGQSVAFVGITVKDSDANAVAFMTENKVPYPSLSESGQPLLALQGKAPSLPTTLILDTEHRIAARVNGAITSDTLTGIIDDVRARTS